MSTNKLLDKLKDILSGERQAQLEKYSSLKKVLKLLRVEKKRLEHELEKAKNDQAREDIETRLKIVSAQRKKGMNVLKELKRERG